MGHAAGKLIARKIAKVSSIFRLTIRTCPVIRSAIILDNDDPAGCTERRRFRMGIKGLMVVVATCALVIWAGLAIRNHFEGYQPLRSIHSGNAIERRMAADDLSNSNQNGIGADDGIAVLVQTRDDNDAGVRSMAAQSLGSLVYQSRNPTAGEPVAQDILKRRIEVATRALILFLSDRDPGVRSAAATGLGMTARSPRPGPLTPEQIAALKNDSNTVRRRAAQTIYGSADRMIPLELLATLKDESADVRAAAARALVDFGPDLDPQVPALIAMMEHDETKVRKACAEALEGAWPKPGLVPTLMAFLTSSERDVRFHAAQLLGRIGPEASAAIPSLIALLKEPLDVQYPDPARAAARALGLMGPRPEAIAALVEVISPENVERSLAAHQARDQSTGDRRTALARESFRIVSAMQGLSDIGPPAAAAIPALIAAQKRALELDVDLIRGTAEKSLAALGFQPR
jgi:HEAT repeat protein